MAILNACAELDDLGGGRFRHTTNLRPIAYLSGGSYQRIVSNWVAGDAQFPHVLTTGPFLSYITPQGDWRIHPTRDPNVWISIGAPFTNPANPTRVSLNPFTRSGNTLTSTNVNFDARIMFGGHLLKLEFVLKTALARNIGQVAFPIGASGVVRVGARLQVNGQTVMNLTPPVVYDAANRLDSRPIAVDFRSVAGQLYAVYTLPSLTGMASPVVDPTLTLQPDATAGKDSRINSANATTNYGTDTTYYFGGFGDSNHILLQFDLSSIPGGSTVTSSILTIYANANSGVPITGNLHRLTQSWTEAGVTWNKYDGSSNWAAAGGDYAATIYATQTFVMASNPTEHLSQDIVTLTQGYVNGTFANLGMLIKEDTEPGISGRYWQGKSSDNADSATRPKLVTVYTEPVGGGGIFASSIPHSAIFGGGVVR